MNLIFCLTETLTKVSKSLFGSCPIEKIILLVFLYEGTQKSVSTPKSIILVLFGSKL